VSEWTRTELVSAISGKVRVRVLTADAARETLAIAAAELASAFQQVTVEGDDFSAANALLERFELGLRAGDALHLAMAQRLREPLVTIDRRLAAAAEAVGVAVVVPG
jgi:predicted nucleic acid-binding protein